MYVTSTVMSLMYWYLYCCYLCCWVIWTVIIMHLFTAAICNRRHGVWITMYVYTD